MSTSWPVNTDWIVGSLIICHMQCHLENYILYITQTYIRNRTSIFYNSCVLLNKQIIVIHELCIWPKGKTLQLCLGLWSCFSESIFHNFLKSFSLFCLLVFIISIWYGTFQLTCCITWNIIRVSGKHSSMLSEFIRWNVFWVRVKWLSSGILPFLITLMW